MKWPTKFGRPIRRSTFGHAAAQDTFLELMRRETRASMLGAIDWLILRHQACPWRPHTAAAKAYRLGYDRERAENPNPVIPPLPDLPRARGPDGTSPYEK